MDRQKQNSKEEKQSKKLYDTSRISVYGSDGLFHYFYEDGTVAEKGYAYAGHFSDGHARVRDTKFGKYKFIDSAGNVCSKPYTEVEYAKYGWYLASERGKFGDSVFLDQSFNEADRYCFATKIDDHGYSIVSKTDKAPYQIRNKEGFLSQETFANLKDVDKVDPSKLTYTEKYQIQEVQASNRSAKTSKAKSKIMQGSIQDYLDGHITVYGLKKEDVLANLNAIQAQEQYLYEQALSFCETEEQMKSIYDEEMNITEYIKQVAYEAYEQNQKNETENKKLAEAKKQYEEKILF